MKTLFPDEPKPRLIHKDRPGKRKTGRPLIRKRPIHLILKSRYILLTHRTWLEARIRDYAQRFGIRLHRFAVCGDHVHFASEIPHADYYKKFIRALTGVVARKMGSGTWKLLPYPRIAKWGADFRNLLLYIEKNRDETELRRRYEPRKRNGHRPRERRPTQLSPDAKSSSSLGGLGDRSAANARFALASHLRG